jgi:enamine deaminase RidA (YjgF/YER057c/UK114 family)
MLRPILILLPISDMLLPLLESGLEAAMGFPRTPPLCFVLLALLAASCVAQNSKPNPNDGYIPVIALDGKKKGRENTQALPQSPELPAAVTAETARLAYQVSPLSSKGLLSQQTRDALKVLLRSNRGPIVKLRAFVAGSGDLRRIGEIAAEMFQEKHLPLPALSVVQVGALPVVGAQVVVEATEVDRKVVNPSGVAFLAAQPASGVADSLAKLKSVLAASGMQPSEALLITCFVSSLDDQRDTQQAMAADFPGAALDYVQMQRAPVAPAASCEATARLAKPASSSDSQMAAVSGPEVVITGTQMAFGNQDGDFKLAFERLEKTLAASKTRFDRVVMAHLYVTASGLSSRVLALQSGQTSHTHPPAVTLVPIESLPSLDALFGIDVIAVPYSAGAQP